MHSYISPVYDQFKQKQNPARARQMKAYLKNQFEFFGIAMPERRQMCKVYMRQQNINDLKQLNAVVCELWEMPQRELQYFAIDLLEANKRLWTEDIVFLLEYTITNKSWWDTVDTLAINCCGAYFKQYSPLPVTGLWNSSTNMWLQRSSLLFQKNYKQQTNIHLLVQYINTLASSKEFFIRKAIGWALREYAKTNVDWVKQFVENNELAALSKREALKHIDPVS